MGVQLVDIPGKQAHPLEVQPPPITTTTVHRRPAGRLLVDVLQGPRTFSRTASTRSVARRSPAQSSSSHSMLSRALVAAQYVAALSSAARPASADDTILAGGARG